MSRHSAASLAPKASPRPSAHRETSTGETSAADAAEQKSKGDLQCESSFIGALQQQGAIERAGELHVATANDGFSAEGLKAAVASCYKGYGETPSAEVLARADESMKAQRQAALAAAKKWQLPDAAPADAAAEQAIKKDTTRNVRTPA